MAVTTEIGTSMGFGSYITGLHLGGQVGDDRPGRGTQAGDGPQLLA